MVKHYREKESEREQLRTCNTQKVIPDTHCPSDPPLRPLSPAARPGLSLADSCKPSSLASSHDTSCWLHASDGGYPTASARELSPLRRPTDHLKLSKIAPRWPSSPPCRSPSTGQAARTHSCYFGLIYWQGQVYWTKTQSPRKQLWVGAGGGDVGRGL